MRILITGGTVFASRFAAEYFVSWGHAVYVLNRNHYSQSNGVRLIACDRHHLEKRLKNIFFDLVFDITAYDRSDVTDLLDALGGFQDYILVSSSAVYPETLPQPFQEDMSLGENIHWGDYGMNKIAAEKVLLARVPEAYIMRPPYLYGKGNNLYREAFVFDCAEKDMPFFVPHGGKMPLQFFDIEDMCKFAETLLEKKTVQRIFNIGNPQTVTVEEWVQTCYMILGRQAKIYTAPENAEVRNYFPFRDVLDVSKQTVLMTDLKPLKQGLKESYEWYKNHKELVKPKAYLSYINTHFLSKE